MNLAISFRRRLLGIAAAIGVFGAMLAASSNEVLAEQKARFDDTAIKIERTTISPSVLANERALGVQLQAPSVPMDGTELSVILWDERRSIGSTTTGGVGWNSGNAQTIANGRQLQ